MVPENFAQPLVLMADDEPDMLRFLKSQLTARYRVVEACDGQQAVDKAGQFLPDIILLDMNMPEKDGLQVCRELRQQEPTQNIPIILLTARADEATKLGHRPPSARQDRELFVRPRGPHPFQGSCSDRSSLAKR